ncbi:MAG: TIM barrel protein [Actinobacteria bacterium]|nr:TIM barrel protein [Actinomycetota bacterium]
MRIGASVPSKDPARAMAERGADCAQIHLSAPRVWKHPLHRPDAADLCGSGIVVAAHAPYLCNPASGNAEVRAKTALNLQATLDEAERCGIAGVVVHAGHAAGGGDMTAALDRWIDLAHRLDSPVPVLIENTASGGTAPGRHLADLARLFEVLRAEDLAVPIGACFDTCHAWAGDPDAATDPMGYVKAFAEATDGIDLLHVNDSKDAAGAGRDRHVNLGEGQMGLETLEAMIVTCAELGVPAAIVETPSEDGGQTRDIVTIRQLLA